MHAALVESVPTAAGRALAEALEIGVSRLRVEDVVFARRIVDVELGPADQLQRVVEFARLGRVADVPGVDEEGGLVRRRQNLRRRSPR